MLYNSCAFLYALFRSAPGKAAQGAVTGKSSVSQKWRVAAVTPVLDAFLLLEVLGRDHLSWAMGTVPLTLSWDATDVAKQEGEEGSGEPRTGSALGREELRGHREVVKRWRSTESGYVTA